MSAISATDDLFASLGLNRELESESTNDPSELGLETFLQLMVTQLNNQDPFEPMDNGQFLSEIAQFSTVSGLDKLNTSFGDLSTSLTSGQALQAGTLVGREVLAPIDIGRLDAGGVVRGQATLAGYSVDVSSDRADGHVLVRVTDEVGQLVRELRLGAHESGPVDFSWDGTTDAGGHAEPGLYNVRVAAMRADGTEDLQTQLYAKVNSVSFGANSGLTLNLQGLGPIAFNNISEIH